MRKRIYSILILNFVIFFFMSYPLLAFNCKNITKDKILNEIAVNPFLKAFLNKSKIVNKRQVKGLCEVTLSVNNRFFTCYVGKDFTLVGQMYSHGKLVNEAILKRLKARTNLEIKKEFLKERKNIDKSVAIIYKPSKKAHKVLYMFTDPMCPFCHKAETKIKDVVKKFNVVLKVIFFPVHGQKSDKMAIKAICKKFNLDKYLSQEWRKKGDFDKFQCEKGKKLLRQSKLIAKKLNITGVPTFIFEDGTRVRGANIPFLERTLQKKFKVQSSTFKKH